MVAPFRWNIARREQLGRLIEEIVPPNLNRNGFLKNLRSASAKILASQSDADLAFIGRTPENFYDYLSGVFSDQNDVPKLQLVHFSMRWAGEGGLGAISPAKRRGLFDDFQQVGLDPIHISTNPRPTTLVDFVAHGGTMENLIRLLHSFCQETTKDWPAVTRKLRIIGLRVQTHNSPNTWRWQQHQSWLDLIPNTPIKNVSAPAGFLYFLANTQDKVTQSHHQKYWDRRTNTPERPTDAQLKALAFAARLYDVGTTKQERHLLAREITTCRDFKKPATRALVLRLKGS